MNDTDINDRPKWLLELENRKRKPRLAHEAGAGAPCVLCKATCPGLDLHFWRKICKNCKCSKGDHDVDDEDFPQFDLLFGSSRKYKKKPILLHINNGKEHTEEEAFEWIPPDATKELAIDYMKALPIEKLPIKGSTGAALRRQLLQKQLPRHDIDYKTCDKLTDQEKKEFEKYLENIKKYVGQGTVTKILSAHPFDGSLVTPVNATDMQHFSPQHKANIPPTFIQLRRPSCFASNSLHKKNLCETVDVQEFPIPLKTSSNCNIKDIPISETYDIISSNGNVVKSETIKNDVYNKGMQQNDSKKISNSNQNIAKGVSTTENLKYLNDATLTNIYSEATPWNSSECYKQAHKNMVKNPSTTLLNSKLMKDNADVTESILADILLPSNTLRTNDIIRSTLDEKGLMYIREKLTNKYSKQENQGQIYNAPNFARSLDSTSSLHQNNDLTSHGLNTSTSINKETDKTAITATMKNPTEMLIPLQDKLQISEPIKGEKEIIKFNPEIVQSEPLDTAAGINTGNLKENVLPISLKVAENAIFTPSSSSKTHLQSYNMNNYQAKINNFITPSNTIHSIKLQAQIFPHETAAKTKQSEQNSPSNIENLKGAMEKLTIDAIKSQKCHKCEEEVKVGDVAIIMEKAKNAAWHPGCFVCNMCNELLVDLVYFYYKNKLYCGRDLATLLGIPRCFACDELIFVREYTVAEGHNYHVKHFCCWECDIPLAGKQYITENDRPLCLLCYQKTYAKTCNMCEKIIAADQQGVAVKDLNFHATETCFCCYICNKSLLNGKFAVKETKIFCSKECISKFLYPRTK